MKNFLIGLLAIAVIALGALSLHQRNQAVLLQAQLADVQKQLTAPAAAQPVETEEKMARAEQKMKAMQESLTETTKIAREKSQQAQALQQSLATTTNENPLGAVAKMFKDPEMKKMLKAQQQAVIGPMIDKQYAELFQQFNLSPEQKATMKELLQKKMLAGADNGMAMMDGSLDATQRAELAKQIKSDGDAYDAQIKQFLGDENYKTFQAYEKTTADRTSVSQFGDQLSGDDTLNPEQKAQLIQALSEERNNFKWTTDFSSQNPPNGDFMSMFTEDKVAQFEKENERLAQQNLARAQQILTPAQLTVFQQFQDSQRSMQTVGLKMAVKMFAPKK